MKPGPVPRKIKPDGPTVGATLPPPRKAWLESTIASYRRFADSESAVLVQPESTEFILELFSSIDQRSRCITKLDDPDLSNIDRSAALRTLKALDPIVSRGVAEWGISPSGKARHGVAYVRRQAKPGDKFKMWMKLDPPSNAKLPKLPPEEEARRSRMLEALLAHRPAEEWFDPSL